MLSVVAVSDPSVTTSVPDSSVVSEVSSVTTGAVVDAVVSSTGVLSVSGVVFVVCSTTLRSLLVSVVAVSAACPKVGINVDPATKVSLRIVI